MLGRVPHIASKQWVPYGLVTTFRTVKNLRKPHGSSGFQDLVGMEKNQKNKKHFIAGMKME